MPRPLPITTRRSPLAAGEITLTLLIGEARQPARPTLHFSPFWGWICTPRGRDHPSPGSRLPSTASFPSRGDHRRREALARSSCSACPGNREVALTPAPGRPAAAHRRRAPAQTAADLVELREASTRRPFAPPPPTGRAVIPLLAR